MTLIDFPFFFFLGLRTIRNEVNSVPLATTALLALGSLSPALPALCPPPKDGRGIRNVPPAPLEPFVTGQH